MQLLLYQDTLKHYRSVQAVFQAPCNSLRPGMKVSRIISEPLRVNKAGNNLTSFEKPEKQPTW